MENNENEKLDENVSPIGKEEELEVVPDSSTSIDQESVVYEKKVKNKEGEPKKIKRSFLDFNFSWIMIFISAAIIIGFGTLQLQKVEPKINGTLYIFIVVLVTIFVNFLVYSGFKFFGGLIGGYQLTKLELFGLTIIFPHQKGKKNIVKFKLSNFLDFHYVMTPKKEKPNHYLYLLSGMFGYIILSVIVIGVAFIFKSGSTMQLSLFFSLSYGALIPLYELLPCRLDYANDCFLLIKTRKKEDLEAYHTELRNIRHLLLDEDIETLKFEKYDTYHKSHMLFYNYLEALYNDDIDSALDYLTKLQSYMIYYPDDLKINAISEKLFVRLFSEDYEGAEEFYGTLSHEFKHRITDSDFLNQYRSNLVVSALINNSLQETSDALKSHNAYIERMKGYKSKRKVREEELFGLALDQIKAARPNWNLEESLEKSKREELDLEEEDED